MRCACVDNVFATCLLFVYHVPTTTSHGLGRAVTETTVMRRIMYAIVFLICLSMFGLFCQLFLNCFWTG